MTSLWNRRRWIQTVLSASAGLSLVRWASAEAVAQEKADAAKPAERSLKLFNTHTNETVNVVFKRGNEFDAAALTSLNHLLRDHRNGEVHEIDPRLFDQLHDLAVAANRVGIGRRLACPYRAPSTLGRCLPRALPGAIVRLPLRGVIAAGDDSIPRGGSIRS